ncbi:MAG: RES family NAD+ phosphorylase [Acidimicrobiales bacterium]
MLRGHDPATGRRRGPFFFSSGSGRFDLELPLGTYYLATSLTGAVLEAFRSTLVDATDVAARRLLRTAVPAPVRLAATTRGAARGFGVTLGLAAGDDRRRTRDLASRLHEAGFDGIHAMLWHDTTDRSRTIALFDKGEVHPPYGWRWPERVTALMTDSGGRDRHLRAPAEVMPLAE